MDLLLLVLLVAVCVAFSLVNGANDLSGMIATLVATRGMRASGARLIALAGLWIGVTLSSGLVAATIALGLVDLAHGPVSAIAALEAWLAGVSGAFVWGLLARRLGVPTSATHAFVGSLCGATLACTARGDLVNWGIAALLAPPHRIEGAMKVAAGLVLSPLVGGTLGFLLFRVMAATLRRATRGVTHTLRRLECAAVLAQAASYGANDAQNCMGVMAGAFMSAHWLPAQEAAAFSVPMWMRAVVAVAVSAGGLVGSANIMRRLGRGLFHVRPPEALAGQVASTVAVLLAARGGAPVSSTQVASSALIGVGRAWRPRHVRWARVREILRTWILTAPGAFGIGFVLALALRVAVPR